jgi:hypothetical protein
MATLKRVGPGSAFKLGMAVYGLIGFLIGVLFALLSMLGAALAPPEFGAFKVLFGIGAILFMPLCYGIIGGIFAAIGAAVYNLVARWVGGLEVDIS